MTSIRRQLTLGLLLVFFLLLGGGSSVFYWSSRRALMNEFDAALRGRAEAMCGSVRQDSSKLEIGFAESGGGQAGVPPAPPRRR